MHIWGKILGFLFGFMLSKNIFGALLGLWLGHKFDKSRGYNFDKFSQGEEQSRQAIYFYTTFSVMGHIAKAKGRVTEHEIAFASAYMDKMKLHGELREQAQEAFRDGKSVAFPLKQQLESFRKSSGARYDLLLMFMEIQIQVAFADGQLDLTERNVLHEIAKSLGFSARDLDKLLEMILAQETFNRQGGGPVNTKSQLNNAYKVLGVTKSDSLKDIKKAYKKQMAQHHPDKLIAKGLPPELMESAKQKTQDIQSAYDVISKHHQE